jgi:hypothetical protein
MVPRRVRRVARIEYVTHRVPLSLTDVERNARRDPAVDSARVISNISDHCRVRQQDDSPGFIGQGENRGVELRQSAENA